MNFLVVPYADSGSQSIYLQLIEDGKEKSNYSILKLIVLVFCGARLNIP